jgi:membrane-associated protein
MPIILFQLSDLWNPETIIVYGGLVLLLLIVYTENGLFFGFLLPGDSLLFVAGLLCETHLLLPVWLLIVLLIGVAFLGSVTGYISGRWAKNYFVNRKEGFFYKKKYLDVARYFFEKHGMMSFILGRFLPVIRTFIPILAGMINMNVKKFLFFNFLGLVVWIVSMVMLGHWIGNIFPEIVNYIEIVVLVLVAVTAIPVIVTWSKSKNLMA